MVAAWLPGSLPGISDVYKRQDYFRKVMEEQLRVESTEKLTVLKKQLARNEKRIADLKRCLLYTSPDVAAWRG